MFSKVRNFHLKNINTNLVAVNSTIASGQKNVFLFSLHVRYKIVGSEHTACGEKKVPEILSSNLWITFHTDVLIALVSHHGLVEKHQWGKCRELCKTQVRKLILPWFSARPPSCVCEKPSLSFRVSLV